MIALSNTVLAVTENRFNIYVYATELKNSVHCRVNGETIFTSTYGYYKSFHLAFSSVKTISYQQK